MFQPEGTRAKTCCGKITTNRTVLTVYRLTIQKHNCISNIKVVIATQANNVYKPKNSKKKILNCNSNIF